MTTVNSVGNGLSGATGTGNFVGANTPTLITPVLGVATATSINFGGTALTNYVEGTWTPLLVGSGGGSATYSLQSGTYTRIGNRILFDLLIATSGSTLSGNITISGLPVAVGTSDGSAAFILNGGGATATPSVVARSLASSSQINLYTFITGNITALTATGLGTSSTIIISGQYHV